MVEKHDALAEVIRDKITAELPSPFAGRLTKILVKADETVSVGTDIALIEEGAEVAAAPAAPAAAAPSAAATSTAATTSSAPTAAPTALSAPARTGNGARVPSEEGAAGQRVSPLARRLAEEHGID